jgi:hypothetical protein
VCLYRLMEFVSSPPHMEFGVFKEMIKKLETCVFLHFLFNNEKGDIGCFEQIVEILNMNYTYRFDIKSECQKLESCFNIYHQCKYTFSAFRMLVYHQKMYEKKQTFINMIFNIKPIHEIVCYFCPIPIKNMNVPKHTIKMNKLLPGLLENKNKVELSQLNSIFKEDYLSFQNQTLENVPSYLTFYFSFVFFARRLHADGDDSLLNRIAEINEKIDPPKTWVFI